MGEEKLTKNEKRVAAREKAALMRENEKKKRTRRRIAGWITAGVSVLAVVAIASFVVYSNNANKMEVSASSASNMKTDGVILTSPTDVVKNTGYNLKSGKPVSSKDELKNSKVPNIEIYVDYACPHCAEFEETNSAYLTSVLESGRATVEIKPVVDLNLPLSFQGGNAAACIADYAPEKFWDFHTQLFKQDSENGSVTSNLKTVLKNLDFNSEERAKVNSCVDSDVYKNWLTGATVNALNRTDNGEKVVTGTPTILVDGFKYNYGPDNFQTFMERVLAGQKPADVSKEAEANTK